MDYICKMHGKFLLDIWHSMKLDTNPYTSIPTFVFVVCTFMLVYFQFHSQTTNFTRWTTRIWRDIMFHWAFFYLTRVWLIFLKFGRYMNHVLDEYIEANSPSDEIHLNKTLTHACIFMLTLMVSMLPLMVLSIQQMYRRDIPNFLMWVAEDPWLRSEIGPSGHYLERPPRPTSSFNNSNRSAYRSKRSTSVDTNIYDSKQSETLRCCKSMMTVNVVKSIHEMME